MVERDAFIAFLLLLGFEQLRNRAHYEMSTEFVLRTQFRSLQPAIMNVVVYQKKSHVFVTNFNGKRGWGSKPINPAASSHHGGALRFIKDNIERIQEQAREAHDSK